MKATTVCEGYFENKKCQVATGSQHSTHLSLCALPSETSKCYPFIIKVILLNE